VPGDGCLTTPRVAGYTDRMSSFSIREMTLADYDAVVALWRSAPGIGLSEADERSNIAAFLAHNPGLSFIAEAGGALCGAVLGSFDGRRGYLHHLAVDPRMRRTGVGRSIVARSLEALEGRGVRRCHIFVMAGNEDGQRFWQRVGWFRRDDLLVMSKDLARR
jgi:ribosomal protein S18 acetylase RimI-like enzyme